MNPPSHSHAKGDIPRGRHAVERVDGVRETLRMVLVQTVHAEHRRQHACLISESTHPLQSGSQSVASRSASIFFSSIVFALSFCHGSVARWEGRKRRTVDEVQHDIHAGNYVVGARRS